MTTWAEIKTGALAYQQELAQKQQADLLETRRKKIDADQRLRSCLRQYFDIAKEALSHLGAREALEAVGHEAWQDPTATIETLDNSLSVGDLASFAYGYQLRSTPYPLLGVRADHKTHPWIEKTDGEAQLGVAVYIGLEDIDGEPTPKNLYMKVEDGPVYNLRRPGFSLKDGVRKLTLSDDLKSTLREMLEIHRLVVPWLKRESINLADPELAAKFNYTIYRLVLYREEYQSLPGQIRDRMGMMIEQLPYGLAEDGRATKEEVRDWYHNTRGSRRLVRWLDRTGSHFSQGI